MTETIVLPDWAIKTLGKKSTITVIAGKARALSVTNPDFVRADIGEVCAPGIFPPGYRESLEKTARDVLKDGRIGYSAPDGEPKLKKLVFKHSIPDEQRELILERLRDEAKAAGTDAAKYVEESLPKYVSMTPGGAGALGAAISVFLTDKKKLYVVNQRTWQNHNLIVDMHGGMLWPVPLIDEQGRVADPDTILALCAPVKERIAALLFSEINNPDGGVITDPAEQKKLEAILRALDVPFILDAAYHGMVYEGKKAQAFSPDLVKKMVTCGSYSKTLQIPGERLGYLASYDTRVVRYVYFYNRSHSGCPAVTPQNALAAHLSLYETDPATAKAYNKALLSELETRRGILIDTVKKELGWKMSAPGGAIYAVIPVPGDVVKAFGDIDKFSIELVEKGGVSAISGSDFEFRVRGERGHEEVYTPSPTDPSMHYLRFCFGFTPTDRVALAVRNLKAFIASR
ncbi:MAG TPA: pyridoxal phosphate-dependent aminotransferase [Thermoanaerobaculia bacterium]|nr:pyridoxal phosphate-dependent aminotransferase [Thermoanaerobaculia bacterium]HQR65900.1 pyridoxal phosphate-dependent aminotransferase [Thermoanaerobaculia bacterium]